MDNEELYLIASNEVDSDQKDEALWAKAMTLVDGDTSKARYEYIRIRVERLASRVEQFSDTGSFKHHNAETEEPIKGKKYTEHVPEIDGYIPVEEFALFRGFTPEDAIEMIQQATFKGRYKNNHWYLLISELNKPLPSETPSIKKLFRKLINGGFALPVSFWIFGILGGLSLYLLVLVVDELISTTIVITGYSVVVLRGIWNATYTYSGSRIWSTLAQIIVIVGYLALLSLVVVAGFYLQLLLSR